MRWLLLLVPISLIMARLHLPPLWLFAISCLAIVPLAGLLSEATEEFTRARGPAIGGLLNATFGNATEMIICIVALQRNQLDIVKASLIGSILGNILLVLGLSILLGGIKYKIQKFNVDVAQAHATMLALAIVALLVPALFVRCTPGINELPSNISVIRLGIGVAIVEILIYVGSLLFSLHTHEQLFQADNSDEASSSEASAPIHWSERKSALILLLASIAIAGESELLIDGIKPAVTQWHLSKIFVGIILVPIIGNAAEHGTAVIMALRNKMDISLNIAVSSSTQIAMFVAPVLLLLSLLMGHPITILFSNFELIAVSAAVAIAVLISLDGKSHWLEGAQLLAVYVIIALAFLFIAK